jgi:hypothetical protein
LEQPLVVLAVLASEATLRQRLRLLFPPRTTVLHLPPPKEQISVSLAKAVPPPVLDDQAGGDAACKAPSGLTWTAQAPSSWRLQRLQPEGLRTLLAVASGQTDDAMQSKHGKGKGKKGSKGRAKAANPARAMAKSPKESLARPPRTRQGWWPEAEVQTLRPRQDNHDSRSVGGSRVQKLLQCLEAWVRPRSSNSPQVVSHRMASQRRLTSTLSIFSSKSR